MRKFVLAGGSAALALGLAGAAVADLATIIADRDNTLYQLSSAQAAQTSNGAGQYLFAGRTAQASNNFRRALLHFDLSSIPVDAAINSVSLTLNCSKTTSGSVPTELHLVQADWGEGASDAGVMEGGGAPAQANDATWFFRFFGTAQTWASAGGDITPGASATQAVSGTGMYTWTSAQMVTNVEEWIADPATNFGWEVLIPDVGGITAKRFDSRESPTVANRPKLVVDFTPVVVEGGACCRGQSVCTMETEAVCTGTNNGQFKGGNIACTPNPCTGQCCAGSICRTNFLASQCSALQATAVYTLGGAGPCPGTTTSPCCKANFNHSTGVNNGITVQDIFDFLTAYFQGKPIADFANNGAGGPGVQSIFSFLAAWFFGGCV